MTGAVYLLCAATSCLCAVLLLRGYTQSWVRLLFWSGLCFVGLTIDNILLYIDLVIVQSVSLEAWRRIPGDFFADAARIRAGVGISLIQGWSRFRTAGHTCPAPDGERGTSTMDQLLIGAIVMAAWVAGLFFLRFWRDTGDRLFFIFAIAFWLLGLTRLAVIWMTSRPVGEEDTSLYWVRFAAFLLILLAIIDKNRPKRENRSTDA